MAHHAFDRREAGARLGHQLMAHAQEVLGDDVKICVRKQMVDVGNAARDRILDRDHRIARIAVFDRRDGVLECRIGDASKSGKASRAARCELAPGSP